MSSSDLNITPLYQKHIQAGAKMVDFAGWDMPIHYGSQMEEHHQVRQASGMFDVSHMVVVDLIGEQVDVFLSYLLANDIGKLRVEGKALYGCMLNEQGGIIDDLIVYYIADKQYRMVVNAATREGDLAWINKQIANYDASIQVRDDLAMIAVQGPKAVEHTLSALALDEGSVGALRPFSALQHGDLFIARTGYTGEDGFELVMPNAQAESIWDALLEVGVKPIGLGARDTLRLEAGMCLYGTDMNESTSPLVSGLEWTVAWNPQERDFIGRKALTEQKQSGVTECLVGLVLEGRGVLRSHQVVETNNGGKGEITSGTFSPTLKKAVALARVPSDIGETCQVVIRDKQHAARVVKPVFVRNGKSYLE